MELNRNNDERRTKNFFRSPSSSSTSSHNRSIDNLNNYGNYNYNKSPTISANKIYKVLLLGDSNVGKTCIVQRFCDDFFMDGYISTIGIDFKQKIIDLDVDDEENGTDTIKLQLWDTAGQERFRALTTAYYRGAMAIIVVFDVTNLESFQHIQYWFKNIDENASPHVIRILVANKCDLDHGFRVVERDQARNLAKRLNVAFYECSCKNNLNIQQIFMDLCHNIRNQLAQNENTFKYDNQINSLEIIKHLEENDRKRRDSYQEQEESPFFSSCSNCQNLS
ncbi:Ras-related protein Rab-13 [Sarcoptes scabiei]|uniref:Ras-related protein Rab-13 n=1 Tax=Sarcoptes scabiei TaxID=52283 RepID=A0A132AJ48_SARSC|nr:Ras-related protein Rab-13 [Sarcoptes scabiei]KPM11012.1 ras-related protein Rab-8A-like protein [Sarcoptes scabiei]